MVFLMMNIIALSVQEMC